MARAKTFPALQAIIEGRLAVGAGIQGWETPYATFDVATTSPQNTFSNNGKALVITRLEVNLFASSSGELDTLERQWRAAFAGYRGTVGGESITSWLESSYDEFEDERSTDSSVRLFRRTLDHMIALIPE